jgi:aspartate kinase
VLVLKFGGTSVADQAAIGRLVQIVRATRQATLPNIQAGAQPDPRGPVVVVSALGGATDRLLGLAAQARTGDADSAKDLVRLLLERHMEVAGIIANAQLRAHVEAYLRSEFDALERVVSALCVLEEVSPRWLDSIAAVGELASSQIVAAALKSHGLAAAWVDARKVMVTSNEHTAAPPLMKETEKRMNAELVPLLATRQIPVMGGFVGATLDGVTTTLGRGGSDYSAAIVGACLDATEIQIWTDVDGMLTADPRLVPHAQVVPELSFDEASELAFFGAKVLHPATILPAMAKNIPVRILNSRKPEVRGTLITSRPPANSSPLTAVATKRNVTVVDITSTRMLMAHGFLHTLFGVFEKHATSVDVVTTSEVSVSVTVDDARRLPKILEDLKAFAEVGSNSDLAVLCVVGRGVRGEATFVSRLLDAVGPVQIRMLSQASERRNITIVIPDNELPGVLARVHEEFFGTAIPEDGNALESGVSRAEGAQ